MRSPKLAQQIPMPKSVELYSEVEGRKAPIFDAKVIST